LCYDVPMLETVFREYARPKGLDVDYLVDLAGFFQAVAKNHGEEDLIRMTIGEDQEGPYLDVDLRDAPQTHAWLSAFKAAAEAGGNLRVRNTEKGAEAVVLPPSKTEA